MAVNYLPEIWIYFACHVVFIGYATYNVYQYRQEIYRRDLSGSIIPGWLGGHQETGDAEWENLKTFARGSIFWFLNHVLLSRLIRLVKLHQFLPIGYAAIGLSYLVVNTGFVPTIFLISSLVPFYCLSKFWGSKGVLLMTIFSLLIANVSKMEWTYYWLLDHMGDFSLFQLVIVYGWGTLKCVSFTLDSLEEKADSRREDFTLSHFLGYVFYFPTMYLGPPIIYSRFRSCYHPNESASTRRTAVITTFLIDLLRTLVWFTFLEFCHHFLYLTSLQYSPVLLNQFPIIALFGYGYLLGQQFQLKYVVSYGFACAIAKLDGVDTPPLPICIARVHKYSDMWKNFDRGLYEFLFKYIYCRFQRRTSSAGQKLLAMFITFSFIYVWHGYFVHILAWAVLNALGIILEMLAKELQKSKVFQERLVQAFSRNNILRIEGICGTHLLILSVIANFFFLANFEVGKLFFKRTYCDGVFSYLGLSITLVFMYYTSEYCQMRLKVRK